MGDRDGVAVVIPTLNEAPRLGPLLATLRQMGFTEIIVADGGSSDETLDIVGSLPGVVCMSAPRGRGNQLHAAVAISSAPYLFMLHADTVPPPDAVNLIRQALAKPEVAGGCFRLRFDVRSPLLDLYAWFSRFECALSTFGDQGYFMRRSTLMAAGGVPEWPLLEDVELRRRLKQAGRFIKLTATVITSARRFTARGVVLGQLRNMAVLAGYWSGIRIETLAWFYRAGTDS